MKRILVGVCGFWAVFSAAAAEWRDITPDGGRILNIAIDPRNASTVYAATCAGLFKSIDSGASWSSTGYGPAPNCGLSPKPVVVDAQNAGTLYIAGCAPSKSTDGGDTWRSLKVTNLAEDGDCIQSIAIDPTNSATLYASPGRRVYKSTDGGDIWIALSSPPADGNSLLLDPQNPALLYAAGYPAGVIRSVDAGATWATFNTGLSGHVEALAVDPVHSGTLYAGSDGRIFRSVEGGVTWQEQSAGLPPAPTGSAGYARFIALAVSPGMPQTVYALLMHAFTGAPAVSYRFYFASSSDGGASWTTVAGPALASEDFTAIGIDSTDPARLYLGTSNGILNTTDGGSRWAPSNSGLKAVSVGSLWADSGVILAANATSRLTTGIAVFRTADGGGTWSGIDLHARVEQLEADPQDSSAVYARGGTDLWKTEDAGVKWSNLGATPKSDGASFGLIATPYPDPLAIDPSNASVMYKGVEVCNFVCDTRIYKSLDSGRTWTRPDFALQAKGSCCSFVSQIAVSPQDSAIVYAGTADGNQTASGLWKSTDGGTTWTSFGWGDITGLALDPRDPNTVYTVWNCCLAKTTDGGKTWNDVDAGLPQWPVGPVLIDPADPDIVYCVTYNYPSNRSEVFRSTDAAKTWQPAGSGLRGNVNSLALDRQDPSIVYAGTTSGLYVLTADMTRQSRPIRR